MTFLRLNLVSKRRVATVQVALPSVLTTLATAHRGEHVLEFTRGLQPKSQAVLHGMGTRGLQPLLQAVFHGMGTTQH